MEIINRFIGSARNFQSGCKSTPGVWVRRQNFNQAVELCSGDHIALCDQDDVWRADKLAVISGIFSANIGTGAVFSDAQLASEKLKYLGTSLWDRIGFNAQDDA